jgi:hypothetical protein
MINNTGLLVYPFYSEHMNGVRLQGLPWISYLAASRCWSSDWQPQCSFLVHSGRLYVNSNVSES